MTQANVITNNEVLQVPVGSWKNAAEQSARYAAIIMAFFIPLTNTGTTICSILFFAFAMLSMNRTKFMLAVKHPVTKALAIFLGLYFIGTLYTVGSAGDISAALRKMTRLLYIPLLFPLFADARWRRAAVIAFLCAMFISVLASLELRQPFFKDSIFTSLFVAFATFITLHFIVQYKRARTVTIPLLFAFVYYLFFICIGRTGQIVFLALYILFCWQNYGKERLLQVVAALILASVFTASILLPSSFSQRQAEAAREVQIFLHDKDASISTSSMGTRLTFAKNAITLIKMKPIFGWGTGAFSQAYSQNISRDAAKNVAAVNPHNQYLLTWVEIGAVGLLSLLYLLFTIARSFWRDTQFDAKLGFGLVFAIAMGCCVNSWLLDFASMFFFAIYAGILGGVFAARE